MNNIYLLFFNTNFYNNIISVISKLIRILFDFFSKSIKKIIIFFINYFKLFINFLFIIIYFFLILFLNLIFILTEENFDTTVFFDNFSYFFLNCLDLDNTAASDLINTFINDKSNFIETHEFSPQLNLIFNYYFNDNNFLPKINNNISSNNFLSITTNNQNYLLWGFGNNKQVQLEKINMYCTDFYNLERYIWTNSIKDFSEIKTELKQLNLLKLHFDELNAIDSKEFERFNKLYENLLNFKIFFFESYTNYINNIANFNHSTNPFEISPEGFIKTRVSDFYIVENFDKNWIANTIYTDDFNSLINSYYKNSSINPEFYSYYNKLYDLTIKAELKRILKYDAIILKEYKITLGELFFEAKSDFPTSKIPTAVQNSYMVSSKFYNASLSFNNILLDYLISFSEVSYKDIKQTYF